MAGLRDDFYYKIGRDYHEHMQNSFLYGYVKGGHDKNLRLRIKEKLFCLADTPASKGKFAGFIAQALLTDRNLAARLDHLENLPIFIDEAESALRQKNNYAANESAGMESRLDKRTYKDALTDMVSELDSYPVLDVNINILRNFTRELLDSCEFEGEKKNPYVQLTSLYLDLECGLIGVPDYVRGVIDFCLANSKYIPGKSDIAVFREFGVATWGKDIFAGMRKSSDKLKLLSQLGKSDKDKFDAGAEMCFDEIFLGDLTERIQNEIIRVEINTLLYDAGYSVDTGVYKPPRKKDKSMDIMDAYFRYSGSSPWKEKDGSPAIPGDYMTWDEYYDACDNLKDTINSDRSDRSHQDMFMPVWIDREVGGGVFLIGKNQFFEAADVRVDNNCELGVVYFIGIEDGKAFEFAAFQAGDFDRNAFPGMEEAVRWFKNYEYKSDSLEEYQSYNHAAPDNCPEVFLKYFEDSESLSECDDVCDDELDATKAEFYREFEADKRREKVHRAFQNRTS